MVRVYIMRGMRLQGLAELLSRLGLGRRPVSLEAELPTADIPLVLVAEASSVKLVQTLKPRLKLRGVAVNPEALRFRLVEEDGRLRGQLHVEDADVAVEAPFNALGVVADSAGVRVAADAKPLRYVSVKADASSITVSAALAQGGGIYVSADSSAVKAELKPERGGEYWAEVEADASGVKIVFVGEKAYIVEERRADASRVAVAEGSREAPVKIKVRVRADSSAVKLL